VKTRTEESRSSTDSKGLNIISLKQKTRGGEREKQGRRKDEERQGVRKAPGTRRYDAKVASIQTRTRRERRKKEA